MGLVERLDFSYPPVGRVRRSFGRFAGTRVGAALLARALPPLDRVLDSLTNGGSSAAEAFAGLPVLSLTTTGIRSGRSHDCYLLGIPVQGDIGVIGTNFGQVDHPAWAHNLAADPRAWIRFREIKLEVRARRVHGEEQEAVWRAGAAVYPGYAMYRARLQRRPMVFVLEAAADR
jgi:deazaflavin-dependent oxidoreductase (nitroreductase family)